MFKPTRKLMPRGCSVLLLVMVGLTNSPGRAELTEHDLETLEELCRPIEAEAASLPLPNDGVPSVEWAG